jgi:hypothetical protein
MNNEQYFKALPTLISQFAITVSSEEYSIVYRCENVCIVNLNIDIG